MRCRHWRAHFWLFINGAYLSGMATYANCVGNHLSVMGDIKTQVSHGTYVHGEGRAVYSQECLARYVNDGILYSRGVPIGERD